MIRRGEVRKIRAQIRRMNHRLKKSEADSSNADRARCGALAIADFASATNRAADMRTDPETVLSDLLADVMHWCDTRRSGSELGDAVRFYSALERAKEYYDEEVSGDIGPATERKE
jgi:hypothetical protein